MLGFKRNPYRALEKKLGYSFRNRALLETALVHPSFRFESKAVLRDNQRLEFLGDAALGLAAAEHTYQRFDSHDEGVLTAFRSLITRGKALAQIARAINLGAVLRVGKGEERMRGRERDTTLADALEAVLGAAYLDGGMRAVDRIFAMLFVPVLETCDRDRWSENPKGCLQDLVQRKWRASPRYRVVAETGPLHARTFTVEVFIGSRAVGVGTGPNKREAETRAAEIALRKLGAGSASTAR